MAWGDLRQYFHGAPKFSIQSLVANAVLGGVASVAAGGNFANGAVTAAFGYLFNWSDHSDGGRLRPVGTQAEIDQINDALGRLCMNSQTACRLIDALRSGPEDVVIRMDHGVSVFRGNRYESLPGWSKTVYFNPGHPELKNFWGAPPEIALGHELVHAFYDVNVGLPRGGSMRMEEWNTIGVPTWGDWFMGRNLTGSATYTANKIRKDYGVPLRPW